MNESKAPKLDVEKIKFLIENILNDHASAELNEMPVLLYHSNRENEHQKTWIYKNYLKIKKVLMKIGFYKKLLPLINRLYRLVPANYRFYREVRLNELLTVHDSAFIENVYQKLLQREPDEAGILYFTEKMIKSEYSKIDVIGDILASEEGKGKNVRVSKYRFKYYFRKAIRVVNKIPVVGYLFNLILRIILLPRTVKQFYIDHMYFRMQFEELREVCRQMEWRYNETIAHQKAVYDEAINSLQGQIEGINASFNSEMSTLINRMNLMEETELDIDSHIYVQYENQFRGTRESIKNRLAFYLPYVSQLYPIENAHVLDVGCGRGEWLEFLRERGIEAVGVDNNSSMVDYCHSIGLNVNYADCMSFLNDHSSGNYHAITAFQLIEHLRFKTMFHFFKLCYDALLPNGFVIFETPNNDNLLVAASLFHKDPTHVNKLTPDVIKFYLEQAGFTDVETIFLNKRYEPDYPGQWFVDEIVYKINMELDFAIVGYKR